MTLNLDVAWNFIRRYEGIESAFYQDDKGFVTYGCGNHALLSQAILLEWETQGRLATDAEIERDYLAVKGAPNGHAAQWYRGYSRCRLSDASIRKLFNDRIEEFGIALSGLFPGFGCMPENAQIALTDMIFNLGAGALMQEFPTFVKAIRLGAYDIAAAHCHRKNKDPLIEQWDPSNLHEARQIAVRDLLLSCVPV